MLLEKLHYLVARRRLRRLRRLASARRRRRFLRRPDPRPQPPRRATVLDTEGEPLRLGLEAEPFLVSPNQREAESLVGQEFADDEDFVLALDAIAEMGARNVLITHECGCFALLREGRHRRGATGPSAAVEAVSPVGAGDVLLAGSSPRSPPDGAPEDALRQAVAAGAASTLEVGAGHFDPRRRRASPRGRGRRARTGRPRLRPTCLRSARKFRGETAVARPFVGCATARHVAGGVRRSSELAGRDRAPHRARAEVRQGGAHLRRRSPPSRPSRTSSRTTSRRSRG